MGTPPREQVLAEWESIQNTAGWREYVSRMEKMLGVSVSNLKVNTEYARVLQLQGEVQAMERVLRIPAEMLKDLKRTTEKSAR